MDLSSAAVPMPADPVTGLLDLFLYQALVDPADSAALTRLGAFLAQVQNLEDAQVFLQQAVERDPQNWLAYALWAHYLDAAGQDAEALAVIQNGRTAAPRNPSLDLPKIRLEGGEVVESPALSKAIEQGRLALRQKNWDAAISVGQSAVTQYPNRYETHLLVGDVFRAQGDLAQAAAAYQDAISLAPYLSFLHGRLAEVLARSGLGQEALQFALNAVAIDQGRWENWLALGQAYTALAEEDLSKLAWAETVLLHAEDLAPPESQAPQQALAELDERHGMTNPLASQPPTAEEIERAVIEDRQGQRDLAQRLLQAGQSGQALILFQALARTDSQDRESRMGLAAALAAEDRVDEAMVEYDQISSDWPDFPYARVHQGTLLEQEGNLPGAIASYRSAVAVAPTNPDTHLVLAYALRKSGDVEEAIAHFEAGLALDPTRTAAQRALDTLRIGKP